MKNLNLTILSIAVASSMLLQVGCTTTSLNALDYPLEVGKNPSADISNTQIFKTESGIKVTGELTWNHRMKRDSTAGILIEVKTADGDTVESTSIEPRRLSRRKGRYHHSFSVSLEVEPPLGGTVRLIALR